jgi:hypothetical protein
MDLYISSLLLGAAGLGTMALSGLGNRGHAGSARGHAHAGSGRGHGHGHGHAGRHTQAAAHGPSTLASRAFWSMTSPRFLFSFALGFGAVGQLLKVAVGGPLLLAAAVVGGVAFERLLVSPLWNFSMRFASAPARMLESAVSDEATAVTSFDANGQGIVSIEVDGQIQQILATLKDNDRLLGARVRAGQRVRIDDVDGDQNRCTVSVL